MADRGDTHYHVRTLNSWFLWSSVFLLVTAVWMVIDDYNAPWKEYQREFKEIELARAEAELATEKAQAALASEAELQAEVQRAQSALEDRRGELAPIQADIAGLRGEVFTALEAAKKAKQEYNWERYLTEEHRVHSGDPTWGETELAAFEQRMIDTAAAQERSEIALAEKEAELSRLTAGVAEAELAAKQAAKSIELVRMKKQSLAPDGLPQKIANLVRDDIPGLDFIGPTIKVEKVVLDDLTFELNFTKKTRIDMCMTCHKAVDRAGFDEPELEQPHRSHPRLDLFVTAKSPHPLKDVGCTICHRGAGEALDFLRVDHNVSALLEPEKAERWEEEHHWHKKHYWDYPMLTSAKIEASCVQCHKTSMDLIAPEAETVTAGYRLFERYGCYSCHKVDWFPTQRKPGPSLVNIQAKTHPDWIAAWIADPRGFRPSTWMPQFFHLENFAPEEEIVKASQYGKGRAILGEEWNDTAVAAIASFILDRAPKRELAPVPVEGDAQRGREAFRVSGCLACHNMAPFEGEPPPTSDPAFDATRTNVHGPNLRGIADKVSPEWLYWWIKDPAALWSETRMPNLRLSDQDAADVAAYIAQDPDGVFSDVPDSWEAAPSPYDMEVLAEQARWYFSRVSRDELEDRLTGKITDHRWDQPEELLVAVGEKLVQQYGCYSCHEIKGLETAMPIGTELSNWGSKTVDKLDWALLANLFQESEGWTQHEREEFKSYRDNWLRQKLHRPRSYDAEKVKNPVERLKMPWFDFESDEVEALITFVTGLVDDEVQHAKMEPDAGQLAMDHGLRAIRQQNCVACHMLEPGTVTFRDDADQVRTVSAELLSMDGFTDAWMHPTPPQEDHASLDAYLDAYGEAIEEEVEEVGFRLLAAHPDVGSPGQNVFVARDDLLDVTPAWGGDFVDLVTNYYYFGVEQFDPEADEGEELYNLWGSDDGDGDFGMVADVDGERRDYTGEPYMKLRWTFAPPVLWDEGVKLQKEWFYAFLEDPVPLRPQVRVRMPTFNFEEGDAGAIADYFAHRAALDWPARFASELRLAQGSSAEELAREAGIPTDALFGIERGRRSDIEAKFPDLAAFAAKRGFEAIPPVDPNFERLVRRSPSHLERVASDPASHLAVGERLARQGPQCFQCHFDSGEPPNADPIAWAPDLALTHDRLREDWVALWLANPDRIYPGTSMPGNFLSDPPQYQEILPDSTNAEQIDAVTDWLFNYDRVSARN